MALPRPPSGRVLKPATGSAAATEASALPRPRASARLAAIHAPLTFSVPDQFALRLGSRKIGDAKAMKWDGQPFEAVRDLAAKHRDFQNGSVNLTHRPILVGQFKGGPLMLVDGYHRAAGFLKDSRTASVPVFVGFHPAMDHWVFYR